MEMNMAFNNHHDHMVATPIIDDLVFDEFMFDGKSPFHQQDFSSSSLISPSYSTNSSSRYCTPIHLQHPQNLNSVIMMMNNDHQAQPFYPPQELSMTQEPSTNASNNTPQIISFRNLKSSFSSDHDRSNYYYKYDSSTTNDHPEIKSLVETKTFSFCTNSASNSKINQSINLDDSDDDMEYFNRGTGIRAPNGKNVNSQQALCHVQAERKRRERLSALFISLSRVVPGLKKLDRISVLEDAIKHMKELQERLKMLEAEEEMKKNSSAFILGDDVDYSMAETFIDHENFEDCSPRNLQTSNNIRNGTAEEEKIQDIKVKMLGKNVLIKIMCDKKYYGCILSMSNKLQKLHLTILDTRVLLFGGCAIDITFSAQMESQFSTNVNDLVQHLQRAIVQSQK